MGSDTRVRYSYSGSGWSMRTIDPATSEPVEKTSRLRPLAWSIGAAVVCFGIILAILSLLMRQPDRPATPPPGETAAVQSPVPAREIVTPAQRQSAPGELTPPAAVLPSEPATLPESREPASEPSGEIGYLPPPTPPAAVVKPQVKPKPAAPIRPSVQSPAASTAHVPHLVLASASARPAEADPISSPVVIGAGQEKRLMLYTELRGLAGQTVSHRWLRNGQTVAVISFKVEGDRWRVHSTKRVTPDMAGAWQVLVVDSRGATLASQSFAVAGAKG